MGTDTPTACWGTIADASALFKLSPDTIRRMIGREEIEAKRFGPRLIRVNLASIESAATPLRYADGADRNAQPHQPAASTGTPGAQIVERGRGAL